MRIKTDSNGFITATGSGLTDYNHTYSGDKEDDIEPNDPSQVEEAWHWNEGNPELRETGASPDPDTAYAEIEQLLIDAFEADGAEDEEVEAMALMNRYDVVINALQRGNYDRVARFTESKIQPNEGIVDDALVSDIKDVLKVS